MPPTIPACVLVCEKDGKVAGVPYAQEDQDSSDLEMARGILNIKAQPIGVAFFLLDRVKGNMLMHARPFESGNMPLVQSVLDRWKARVAKTPEQSISIEWF